MKKPYGYIKKRFCIQQEKFDAELLKRPKLSTFKQPKVALDAVAMKDEMPLGVVNEENEDECEQSTNKMTPFI